MSIFLFSLFMINVDLQAEQHHAGRDGEEQMSLLAVSTLLN